MSLKSKVEDQLDQIICKRYKKNSSDLVGINIDEFIDMLVRYSNSPKILDAQWEKLESTQQKFLQDRLGVLSQIIAVYSYEKNYLSNFFNQKEKFLIKAKNFFKVYMDNGKKIKDYVPTPGLSEAEVFKLRYSMSNDIKQKTIYSQKDAWRRLQQVIENDHEAMYIFASKEFDDTLLEINDLKMFIKSKGYSNGEEDDTLEELNFYLNEILSKLEKISDEGYLDATMKLSEIHPELEKREEFVKLIKDQES